MKNEYKCKPRINYSTHFQRDESVDTRDSQNLFEVTPFNRHQGTSPAAPLIPSVSTAKRRAKIINEPAFRFLPLPPPSLPICIYFIRKKFREKKVRKMMIQKCLSIRYREMQATISKTGCRTQTNFLLSRLYRGRQPGLRDNLEDFYFSHCSFQFSRPDLYFEFFHFFFPLRLSFFLVSSNARYTR